MAANLKKTPEKKEEKGGQKAEGQKVQLDLKWILAGLGLVAITMGSVIIGIQLAPPKQVIVEKKTLVEKLPAKPGPAVPVFMGQVVNLNGGRYLRFSVVVQFAANDKLFPAGGGGGEGKKKDPFEPYMAMMKDTCVTAASRHTADELLVPKGKDKLKDEIRGSLNSEFEQERQNADDPVPEVIKVYFTDFVIQ